MSDQSNVLVTTGRRKTASARVRVTPGTGVFIINGKPLTEYCYDENLVRVAELPLVTAEKKGQFDVTVLVQGGGPHGQATAISHGLARALEKNEPDLRGVLKKAGLLRRDPRRRERKKAGQPGARKRFQFSKR